VQQPAPVPEPVAEEPFAEYVEPAQITPLAPPAMRPIGAPEEFRRPSKVDRSYLTAPAFVPEAPGSLEQSGLAESDVVGLVLKFLYYRRVEIGFRISQQLGLKLPVLDPILREMKQDRLVVYKGAATAGDYIYELTDLGLERARNLTEQCTYFGTAPVPLDQYVSSVKAQSLDNRRPPFEKIQAAFGDMTMSDDLLSRVGQAIYAGRGMFLFGNAGNGKTSLAERITRAFGDTIWIPKALITAGEIIRLYDPNKHRLAPGDPAEYKNADGRWVHIQRPTIVAGGELRMDNLEIAYTRGSGIGEAPLQLKANCGTLLIDDFGRQRMSVDELLNRWIVPLEARHDFLYLESGRTIQVPFDQLIVFSTNLEPRDLVEEAFLRRIPYKIEVTDPTEEQFETLFLQLAAAMGIACAPQDVVYLLDQHYRATGRGMRFCHPRDLLRQIENYCLLVEIPPEVTPDRIDVAVANYFSIM
jgi:MoxR-like ATPase